MTKGQSGRYFLKLLGISKIDPLPARWWETRSELLDAVFFSSKPRAITAGATLIYYAVGSGRLCGVARVTGEATTEFASPPNWSVERRRRFG